MSLLDDLLPRCDNLLRVESLAVAPRQYKREQLEERVCAEHQVLVVVIAAVFDFLWRLPVDVLYADDLLRQERLQDILPGVLWCLREVEGQIWHAHTEARDAAGEVLGSQALAVVQRT